MWSTCPGRLDVGLGGDDLYLSGTGDGPVHSGPQSLVDDVMTWVERIQGQGGSFKKEGVGISLGVSKIETMILLGVDSSTSKVLH